MKCDNCGRSLTKESAGVIIHDSGKHGTWFGEHLLDALFSFMAGDGYWWYYCDETCCKKSENGANLLRACRNPKIQGFKRIK